MSKYNTCPPHNKQAAENSLAIFSAIILFITSQEAENVQF